MDMIALARQLGHAIQEHEAYIRLEQAKIANDNDTELQAQIGEFNLKRMQLNEEASKTQADEDKISALNSELMAIYNQVMENENMKAYNDAKQEVDAFMNHINAIIVGAVNGENPDDIELSSGCSGSCSTCGGCH